MKKRLLSALLSLAMLVSVIPTTAVAKESAEANEQSEQTDSGLSLSKTAKLEEDGTYTITLEAYAEGETQTVYKPMDILFVLDQSGSMLTVDDATKNVYVDYNGDGTVKAEIEEIEPEDYINNLVDLNGDGVLDRKDKKINITGLSDSISGQIQYYTRENGKYTVLNDADFEKNAAISGYYINATSYMVGTWRVFRPALLSVAGNSLTDHLWKNVVIEKKNENDYRSIKDDDGNIKYQDVNGDFVLAKTRYGVLTDVTTNFINKVHEVAEENHTDHRMGLVGFSGDSSNKYDGTALYITSVNDGKSTWQEYKYDNEEIDNQYANAFRSVQYDNAFLNTMRDYKAFAQWTRPDFGLQMANSVFEENDYTSGANKDRKKIVIFITDGEPVPNDLSDKQLDKYEDYADLTNYNENTAYAANESIAQANQLKEKGVEIYSIGMLRANSGNRKTLEYLLDRVSSNYSYSNDLGNKKNFGYMLDKGSNSYVGSKADNTGYCNILTADDSLESELERIFASITSNITYSTTKLDSNAVLKDIVAEEFALVPLKEGDDLKDYVTVEVSDYLGNGKWSANHKFENAQVTVEKDSTTDVATVSVTGFDYAGNYISDAVGGQTARGQKLVVTIKNILARDEAATGEPINTNGSASGIYPSAESTSPAALFENPTVTIPKKSYVLDYAKPVEVKSSDWNMGKVIDLDDTSLDKLMSRGTSIQGTADQPYGMTKMTDTGLRYTPQTMNWDGYDGAYVFGNLLTDASEYMWSKVNFIPATNVYYEDSFVTSKETGVTGITYSEGWSLEGYSGDNVQSDANIVYGNDSSYDDNTGFSDGSANKATKSGATAEFTFTGTGVEIYTKTDSESGQVLVQAVGENSKKIYTALVDNRFESIDGGLYAIPTVAFENMVRDTYKVTLIVLQNKEGNSTYYLDAIRIYNPIDEDTDTTVKEAYTEAKEDNAVTATVREYLLDPSNFEKDENGENVLNGAVYIDDLAKAAGSDNCTKDISTYEKGGPKNEVYLEKDNAIAFEIKTDYNGKALLGLKAAEGKEVTVNINGKEMTISSTADMYYEIEPNAEKQVCIKNVEGGLLSVTKLRLTEVADPQGKISLAYTQSLSDYIKTLVEVKDGEVVTNPFSDVKEDDYFYDAVLWAVENEITSGYSETEFGTGDLCTRAQAITFLWRAAGCPEPTSASSFIDVEKDSYYYKAVLWAKENGIATGVTKLRFAPNQTITRGEFVTFLYRMNDEKVIGVDYYNALIWASRNGITDGIGGSKFEPAKGCTREQIVTFLWRYMSEK